MKSSEKVMKIIGRAEVAKSYEMGIYHMLSALVFMEFHLNKNKLDTIEVKE